MIPVMLAHSVTKNVGEIFAVIAKSFHAHLNVLSQGNNKTLLRVACLCHTSSISLFFISGSVEEFCYHGKKLPTWRLTLYEDVL